MRNCSYFSVLYARTNAYYYKKQKTFPEKQKGFRDGLSYSTPQKSEEAGAITQVQSYLI